MSNETAKAVLVFVQGSSSTLLKQRVNGKKDGLGLRLRLRFRFWPNEWCEFSHNLKQGVNGSGAASEARGQGVGAGQFPLLLLADLAGSGPRMPTSMPWPPVVW